MQPSTAPARTRLPWPWAGALAATAAAVALLLPGTALAASHLAEVVLWARTDSPFIGTPAILSLSDSEGRRPAPASVAQAGTIGDGNAQAQTRAAARTASGGGVHLSAWSLVQIAPSQAAASADASALGDFEDSFVVNVPGLASGTVVNATIALRVHGGLSVQSTTPFAPNGATWTNASSNWNAAFIVAQGGTRHVDWFGTQSEFVTNGAHSADGISPGQFVFALPLTLGQPVALRIVGAVAIDANVSSRGSPLSFTEALQATGDARLQNTIAWDGLLSLTDAQGAVLSGYSAFNADGIDYVMPYVSEVPEPGAGLLFAAGLLVMLQRRARLPGQPRCAALP